MQVICGDFASEMRKIIEAGQKFDAVITDPPYATLRHKIETAPDMQLFFKLAREVLREDALLVVFGDFPEVAKWISYAQAEGFAYKNNLVWDKGSCSSPFGAVGKHLEHIFVFAKGNATPRKVMIPVGDAVAEGMRLREPHKLRDFLRRVAKLTANPRQLRELADFLERPKYDKPNKGRQTITFDPSTFSGAAGYVELGKSLAEGFRLQQYIRLQGGSLVVEIDHPTVKPVRLMQILVELATDEGAAVLDPFAGSGSTLVACDQLGRSGVGIELYPEYAELAESRLKKEGTLHFFKEA